MQIVAEKDKQKVNQAMIDLVSKNKTYDIIFEITPKNTSTKKIIHSIAELHKRQKMACHTKYQACYLTSLHKKKKLKTI